MATRFRRSIKVAPGVKININKGSASMTVGTKGAHITKSTNGSTTKTAGIPGTGLSYVDRKGGGSSHSSPVRAPKLSASQAVGLQKKSKAMIGIVSGINEQAAKQINWIACVGTEIQFQDVIGSCVARLQIPSIQSMDVFNEVVTSKFLKTERMVVRFKIEYLTKKGNLKTVIMDIARPDEFDRFLDALKDAVSILAESEE